MTPEEYVQQVADLLRPALNIDSDRLVRVSHGQDDIAVTVVNLVIKAMNASGWAVYLPAGSSRDRA